VVGLGGLGFLPSWPGMLVTMGAFCAAVYHRERGPGLVLAVCGCWVLVSAVIAGSPVQVFTVTDLVVMGVAPVATGYALRLHRERAGQALRVQRAEADRVLAEERAQLARDVHDSVGHHLTAIRMQATAVRRVLGGTPAVADRALGTIAELSSSALEEVRGLLGALRDVPVGGGLEGVEGLEGLGRLVERLSGVDRRIVVKGVEGVSVPVGVGRTAYRVVQEALTNVVRHSGAGEVEVEVRLRGGWLVVTVVDDGEADRPWFEGQGIRGMRERVRLVGGTLVVGPGVGGSGVGGSGVGGSGVGGWRVRAELPVEA
jgi:signal transduction histidine kinase